MSDDDEPEEIASFTLPLGGLMKAAQDSHDRLHMAIDQKRMELWRFLDGLTKDQLLALRTILNLSESGTNYVDGMVAGQLRLLHKVDPDTGEDLPAALT